MIPACGAGLAQPLEQMDAAAPAFSAGTRARRLRYNVGMTSSAQRLLQDVLALPEDERLEFASEIIASVDGPHDADWEEAWLAELDRRVEAAKSRGEVSASWIGARARILERLAEAPNREQAENRASVATARLR
jgi:putative addiction module component (TIGR02574 family)